MLLLLLQRTCIATVRGTVNHPTCSLVVCDTENDMYGLRDITRYYDDHVFMDYDAMLQ